MPYSYPGQSAQSVFFDMRQDRSAQAPQNSVRVPQTGTVIEVLNTIANDSVMRIRVRPAQ